MSSVRAITVRIDQIKYERSERQRTKLSKIEEIADSMRRLGQFHPVIIDQDFNLADGEGRIEAAKLLGWDCIECRLFEDLDEKTRIRIELEANIKRQKDLTWQDRALAIAKVHEIYESEDRD